jgi:uncharacterized membrane protein (GlpM family)
MKLNKSYMQRINIGGKDNWIKLILSALFLLIPLNLLLLKLNPLPGYVYSFYDHVPILFWVFSVTIFFGASILLIEFRFLQKKYVYILFFLILLNNAVILFSPYICGAYAMNGGDLLTHGGMVLDIFHSGKIDFDVNFYPLTHIFAFSISSLSNINYIDSIKILSPIFSLLLPLYFYILAKEIIDNQFVQNLAFLIGSTFYFSSLFSPNSITTPLALSLLMLPLLFSLFIKSTHLSRKTLPYTICLLPSFSAYALFHPITSIVLAFALILLYVLGKSMKIRLIYRSILFFLCAVSAYFIYLTTVWVRPVQNIYHFLLGYRIPLGYAVDIQEGLGKLGLTGFELASFFIKTFGHQALLLLFSFFSVISTLFGRKREKSSAWFLTVLAFMLVSSILFLVSIFIPALINISFFRFLEYLIVFSPILSSLFLSTLRKRGLVILVLSFLFINGLLVVYPSPYIHQVNTQVTHMDLSGSQWVLDHKDPDVGLSGYFGYGITIRMISGLIPYSQFIDKRYIWQDKKSLMPDHLGYEENDDIWDTIQEERYLIISKYDIVAYTQVYRNIGRISLEDIEKMNNDYTALLIYNNGEYAVFYLSR